MTQDDVLKNRVKCMNDVKRYINEIAPQIVKELEKGFSLTRDYQLFKKDKERIDVVINSKEHFRAILQITEYSIWLNVDAHYQTDPHGCAYYKESVYLWDVKSKIQGHEVKQRELVSYKQLKNAEVELEKLKKDKSDISYRISRLELLVK